MTQVTERAKTDVVVSYRNNRLYDAAMAATLRWSKFPDLCASGHIHMLRFPRALTSKPSILVGKANMNHELARNYPFAATFSVGGAGSRTSVAA